MKNLILAATFALIGQNALACINIDRNNSVCVGDIVYSGTSFSNGATVLAINPSTDVVTVRSNYNSQTSRLDIRELDLTNSCLANVCTNDVIYQGTSFSMGAKVVGINLFRETLTVRSNYNSQLSQIQLREADLTKGCVGDICVDDIVYKGSEYSLGARVIAINQAKQSATVKSNYNSQIHSEALIALDITSGCMAGVCVGDVVFQGDSYSMGAVVVAINYRNRTATVKSRYNSQLYSESIQNLDVSDANSRYSNQERYQNDRRQNEPNYDEAVDVIVDTIIDIIDDIANEPVATCTVVNSSGTVIGSNIAKVDFVDAVRQYALDENSCVIANEKGVTRSHVVVGKRGEILGSNLSENEASDVRDAYGYSRCRRATCQ